MFANRSFSRLVFLAAAALTLGCTTAQAQFVGGTSPTVVSVKDMLATAHDDQLVVLEGYLVNQVKHEKYTFKDASGTVLVEIDDKVFAGQRVDPNTKIRIEGEFEKELMKSDKVEVHRLTIIR